MKRYFIYRLVKEVIKLPFTLMFAILLAGSMAIGDAYCNVLDG